MEPGHEDREYIRGQEDGSAPVLASMEPGHEDREYEVNFFDDFDID